ncbi:MAG: LysR family transcriptional regulator [Deltaproteobacteria bacterium]|nr:LysR family transcriptional regulator [Deltaproteobacteria bacterium]
MNLDRLATFHRVAVTKSFTKAAERLFLSQPAVTQQIQALEQSLGVIVFDRSGKRVKLTPEGETLLGFTKRLFALHDEITACFQVHRNLGAGKITIGSTRMLGTYYLPRAIGLFNATYPAIELDMKVGNSRSVWNMILEGAVDYAFAGGAKGNPRIARTLIHREPLILVSAPHHKLSQKELIVPEDLIATPFIWRERGTQTREVVTAFLNKTIGRGRLKQTIEMENIEAAKRIVEEGYGVTIIPQSAVSREIERGALVSLPLTGSNLHIDFYFIHRKKRSFSTAAREFLTGILSMDLFSQSNNLKPLLENSPPPVKRSSPPNA